MTPAVGRVESVNVGAPREVQWGGRTVRSAIWKDAVTGPVAVRAINLDGDDQADRRVHGGADKAVYAYAREDYEWWSAQMPGPLAPGTFGENLTTAGVDLAAAVVGERWRVGTAVLEVTQPRLPCFKLGIRMGDATFVERFTAAGRFGTYFRVRDEGVVAAGAPIVRLYVPRHGLRVSEIAAAHHGEVSLWERIAAVADVPAPWRAAARRALARAAGEAHPHPAN